MSKDLESVFHKRSYSTFSPLSPFSPPCSIFLPHRIPFLGKLTVLLHSVYVQVKSGASSDTRVLAIIWDHAWVALRGPLSVRIGLAARMGRRRWGGGAHECSRIEGTAANARRGLRSCHRRWNVEGGGSRVLERCARRGTHVRLRRHQTQLLLMLMMLMLLLLLLLLCDVRAGYG